MVARILRPAPGGVNGARRGGERGAGSAACRWQDGGQRDARHHIGHGPQRRERGGTDLEGDERRALEPDEREVRAGQHANARGRRRSARYRQSSTDVVFWYVHPMMRQYPLVSPPTTTACTSSRLNIGTSSSGAARSRDAHGSSPNVARG